MSELELSMFRQRSQEALKQKARRGALVLGVAAGYVKIGRDRIEKNPDKRVQDHQVRRAATRCTTGAHLAERGGHRACPSSRAKCEAHGVVWRLPAYNIVHNILTNPIYAGAYAFGRTKSRVSVRRWTQAYPAWCAKAHGRMGCLDQGSPRGLHHLGRVRAQRLQL